MPNFYSPLRTLAEDLKIPKDQWPTSLLTWNEYFSRLVKTKKIFRNIFKTKFFLDNL